ncbi:hypothetical protein KOI35_33700 [Actinoplanes bogorensis]|uniref:Caspase domain-containing protein n=1 Tax=Paractinoplanes bogorensis TaxID=1610840 RepID=A0ABS5YYE5_9ACTN|nr:hypothetical protein [Actinoplanes bogorensis]MBU2668480.1 hypothetical protein [Actinoplanes bogorensis]
MDKAARLDPGQSVALLIGVADCLRSDYPRVGAAHENVRRMAAELGAEDLWGVAAPTRLYQLFDPDRATVLRAVADVAKLVGRQGALLVYFVGYAEPVGTELCLATRDTERANPRATGVSVTDLVAAAGGSRADKRMLVLDCCHSDRAASALPGVSVKVDEAAGWYFAGAADAGSEAPADGETTSFTAALLEAMRGSVDGDERLTPADVTREAGARLPAGHQPVHNDIAWAGQVPWLNNRQYVPRPRVPVVLSGGDEGIPRPPRLYAEPHYIGSHEFVGRQAQLETLDDWATPAQPHPILLFEAIGGTGKSMLTWQWLTQNTSDRWAGRFWYSFYEKGALMGDFCRRALAYMTGRPPAGFADLPQTKLTEQLLHQLHSRPWLLVLDGLERVLVSYHRFDASQMPDEMAGRTDEMGSRDPCSAIRPLDDELLRQLAAASPSKVLITSRLTPRIMLNSASQPIPGVLVERLSGFRPQDAEELLRSCGVRGDSSQMQTFLQRHCDCHPLVTGVVAGLIAEYLPDRGNFDRWAADPEHGGRLDVGDLDLVQKRNHILEAAIRELPSESWQLLAAIALLPGAADHATLEALNPHRSPPPARIAEPIKPEKTPSEEENSAIARAYQTIYLNARARWQRYEQLYAEWESSAESRSASANLAQTVSGLERRGLLQYDRQIGRWDLHPVVRAIGNSRLAGGDRGRLGQQIIDHFSQRIPDSLADAESLEDLRTALTVVSTLIQLDRLNDACEALSTDITTILLYNLEAYPEYCAVVRPLFKPDWSAPIEGVQQAFGLCVDSSIALSGLGLHSEAAQLSRLALRDALSQKDPVGLRNALHNLAIDMSDLHHLALGERCCAMSLALAEMTGDREALLIARVLRMGYFAHLGQWSEAEKIWITIESMDLRTRLDQYRLGNAELSYLARVKFPAGRATSADFSVIEDLARSDRNRSALRSAIMYRGEWRLHRGEPAESVAALQEALRMANEVGVQDLHGEALLALALLRSGQGSQDAAHESALRLSAQVCPPDLPLAHLWRALGERARAVAHARSAYVVAWGDGEPYVHRTQLDEAALLIRELGEQVPRLAPYDPRRTPPEDWEPEAAAVLATCRTEYERRRAAGESPDNPWDLPAEGGGQ